MFMGTSGNLLYFVCTKVVSDCQWCLSSIIKWCWCNFQVKCMRETQSNQHFMHKCSPTGSFGISPRHTINRLGNKNQKLLNMELSKSCKNAKHFCTCQIFSVLSELISNYILLLNTFFTWTLQCNSGYDLYSIWLGWGRKSQTALMLINLETKETLTTLNCNQCLMDKETAKLHLCDIYAFGRFHR